LSSIENCESFAKWLLNQGDVFGFCKVFVNELGGCPRVYHNSTRDVAIDFALKSNRQDISIITGSSKRKSRFRRSISCKRSEEHTSELQSRENLVCRLL